MTIIWVIWIAVGALLGALINTMLKVGKIGMVGRIISCVLGAIAMGWLLPLFNFEIGGPYIGAVINAAIGAVLSQIGVFAYDNFGS